MRARVPVLSLAAAAVLAFAGMSADATPTALNSLSVVDQNAVAVQLVADAPASLAGAPCATLEGPAPFSGVPVAVNVLHPGPNSIVVPQLNMGWFTVMGPFAPATCAAAGGQMDDVPGEYR